MRRSPNPARKPESSLGAGLPTPPECLTDRSRSAGLCFDRVNSPEVLCAQTVIRRGSRRPAGRLLDVERVVWNLDFPGPRVAGMWCLRTKQWRVLWNGSVARSAESPPNKLHLGHYSAPGVEGGIGTSVARCAGSECSFSTPMKTEQPPASARFARCESDWRLYRRPTVRPSVRPPIEGRSPASRSFVSVWDGRSERRLTRSNCCGFAYDAPNRAN